MVTIACMNCGKEFRAYPNRFKSGRAKYCSQVCKNEYQKTLTKEQSPRYGVHHTEASRQKMSDEAKRRWSTQLGPNHPAWKGGMYLNAGYRHVAISQMNDADQELAWPMALKGNGYVLEHRIVMARKLGRPLTKQEIVHHLNGDKLDNRPENLTVMETGPHSMEHRKIERELTQLREENRRLKSLLMTYLPAGSDISSLLESI